MHFDLNENTTLLCLIVMCLNVLTESHPIGHHFQKEPNPVNVSPVPFNPWARGRNFTYWYHLWWQRLVMIFRIGHVSAIYFDMIALWGWQLQIDMSSLYPHPMKRGQTDEQAFLSKKYLERGNVYHIINLSIRHT